MGYFSLYQSIVGDFSGIRKSTTSSKGSQPECNIDHTDGKGITGKLEDKVCKEGNKVKSEGEEESCYLLEGKEVEREEEGENCCLQQWGVNQADKVAE